MDKVSNPPKKPLQPFFAFIQKEREKGNMIGGKEAGRQWNNLPEKEKQPYISEFRKRMMEFEKYLEEVEGIKPRPQAIKYAEKLSPMGKSGPRPDHFRAKRIRAVCGSTRTILPMSKHTYKALGRVLVFHFQ